MREQYEKLRLLLEQKGFARKRRENTNTTFEMISDYKCSKLYRRRKETRNVLEYIHGGLDGAIYGAWDFIKTVSSTEKLEKLILSYKRGRFLEGLFGKFKGKSDCDELNLKKAVATKYVNYLSRRKYNVLCKIQKYCYDSVSETWGKDDIISYGDISMARKISTISHKSLKDFVDQIDIGSTHQIPGYTGVARTVTALVTMISDLHLKVKSLNDNLVWFNENKNHFIVEFSDDGAPESRETTMTVGTLTLWNFGNRIRSRDSHYLLHVLSANEKDIVCENLWQQHTEEMQLIQSNVFTIRNEKVTFEFQPSADQAWQCWAANVLTQSASYPSPYANVHKSQLQLVNGSIGTSESDSTWKVPNMDKRIKEVKALENFRKTLPSGISPENIHKRELSFMAENGYRQLGHPRIGIFADSLRPEPLHLEINNWQHVLDLIYKESVRRGKYQDFCKVLSSSQHNQDLPGCGLKFVANIINEHYNNEQKRMNKLSVRIIGSQAISLAQFSFRLIDAIVLNDGSEAHKVKLAALSKICQCLRDIGALMNRVNVGTHYARDLNQLCQKYFNLFSLFFPESCQSTVWTLGYAMPFCAEKLYNSYGVGYGILSMQGKESKHSALKQELKCNTNRSIAQDENGKWNQIMQSNFIRSFYLPYHFPMNTGSYHSHYQSRIPFFDNGGELFCKCSRKTNHDSELCEMCEDAVEVLNSAENGVLAEAIVKVLKPVVCVICKERFADFRMCDKHVKVVHESTKKITTANLINPDVLSVSQLKYYLKERNQSTSGSKEILKRRLSGILSTE